MSAPHKPVISCADEFASDLDFPLAVNTANGRGRSGLAGSEA